MSLITTDELRTKLQRDIDEAVAAQACDLASAQVQAITRQTIVVADHTQHCELVPRMVDGTLRLAARLWQRPVITVDTVTVAGAVLDSAAWSWEPALDAVIVASTVTSGRATIEYSAGYDPVPGDLKAAALHLAALEVANPTGVVSERLGDYQVTWSDKPADTRVARILADYAGRAGSIRVR